MSEDQKRQLNQQLWNIANTLRGKMDADEFRDYILGFIFYKYLSEKMELYANDILKEDKMMKTLITSRLSSGCRIRRIRNNLSLNYEIWTVNME
jgi:type I restriction enzyme M protein